MRTAALTLLCIVAFGYAMNAQKFSLLPQAGFENSKTTINYNNGKSFAPEGVSSSPQFSVRLNYASKMGHGFFLGGSTSRNIVAFTFTDPETGMSNYTTTPGNKQFRFEGGYQFSSKPISLGKSRSTTTTSKSPSAEKKNCPFSQKSSCRKNSASKQAAPGNNTTPNNYSVAKSKGPWIKIQPSVGMGFMPGLPSDIVTKPEGSQTAYEYRAGNWQTAFIAGTSFEFGCGDNGFLTVSVNYIKGVGNLNSETLTITDGVKTTTTSLQSSVSGWNLRFGIPFNLGKQSSANGKSAKNNVSQRKPSCQQYRYRCTKSY